MRFREKLYERQKKYQHFLMMAMKYSDYGLFDIIMERMKNETDEKLHEQVQIEIESDSYNIL